MEGEKLAKGAGLYLKEKVEFQKDYPSKDDDDEDNVSSGSLSDEIEGILPVMNRLHFKTVLRTIFLMRITSPPQTRVLDYCLEELLLNMIIGREMRQFHTRNLYVLLFLGASFALVSALVLTKGLKGSPPWHGRLLLELLHHPFLLRGCNEAEEFMNPGNGLNEKSVRERLRPRDAELERVEAGLARARALIREGTTNWSSISAPVGADYVPQGDIYRNATAFHRSFRMKDYHLHGSLSIWSVLQLNGRRHSLQDQDPDEAHVYFLPFSVVMIIHHLFDPIVRDKYVMKHVVSDYVKVISQKYRYWNRSLGADHFMLSCHDWVRPRATWYVPQLYYNSIRLLCNANTSERFNPRKDASIPEINLIAGETIGLTGGLPPSKRTILAFFAGGLHGRIRPALLQHWKEKDEQVQVYETLPEGLSYPDLMKKSKYCICPSGHEVASPRIVEAIYAECVPVLISQHYVLPFSDVLDWGSFSIQVSVNEIPNLKKILLGIPQDRYIRMQERVKQVQQHFVVNNPPKRFDEGGWFVMVRNADGTPRALNSSWFSFSFSWNPEEINPLSTALSPSASSSFNASLPDVHIAGGPYFQPPLEKKQETWKDKRYSKLERLEAGLARARSSIREAARNGSLKSTHEDPDYVPQGPIYRNANAFHRSYLEMEKLFKIYVYEEGEPPMFHNGPCKSIYSTEGRFIHEMEKGSVYRTTDPDQALLYFLPFSVVMMVQYLYVPDSHEIHAIENTVIDYIKLISHNHPFWNRSLGADHFMISCHDWGPRASTSVPYLYNNSIRVLCNANTSEGFNPSKDVSFPEIHLRTGEMSGPLGGLSPSRRPILGFFAGRLHGHIRYLLLEQWKDKDKDLQVYDQLPNGLSYDSMLKKSRFCLCPSGYEVASPRVVEAIYAECVPVLISDNYVPPFNDVLNWKSFAVQVQVRDIANIKKILMGISQTQYLRMYRRVKQVQRHFMVNAAPQRFDVFHMTIHSIWLRRLNIRIQD
ncbi:putative glycosyltransferase [Vitis vinifera]|uniref:Putative glycosyltransferase n=1 Tax=Vitis vinifera TaxID=29760 RepID=A0A438JH63_VITVI|nr:putative glycosyltransferase [Vitis vinifera]